MEPPPSPSLPLTPPAYEASTTTTETMHLRYGNSGCGVFKRGYKIRKCFVEDTTYLKEIIEFGVLD